MNEARLKELGVSDEAIKAIMDDWTRTTGANAKEVENYKAQARKYSDQLKELEKVKGDNEQLSAKIAEFQKEQETSRATFAKEMAEFKRSQAIKYALGTLKDGKPYDASIVQSLLDSSKIAVDDNGNVTGGFDEQISALRKEKAFLFEASTANKPRIGVTPPANAPQAPEASQEVGGIGARLAAQALAASHTAK